MIAIFETLMFTFGFVSAIYGIFDRNNRNAPFCAIAFFIGAAVVKYIG